MCVCCFFACPSSSSPRLASPVYPMSLLRLVWLRLFSEPPTVTAASSLARAPALCAWRLSRVCMRVARFTCTGMRTQLPRRVSCWSLRPSFNSTSPCISSCAHCPVAFPVVRAIPTKVFSLLSHLSLLSCIRVLSGPDQGRSMHAQRPDRQHVAKTGKRVIPR